MNNDKYSQIISFDAKISETGEIDLPREKLLAVLHKGYKEIKVYIYGDSKRSAIDLGFEPEVFNRIKEIQSIPDAVVLDFLKTKGSLTNTMLEKRVLLI